MPAAEFNGEFDFETSVVSLVSQYPAGLLGLPGGPLELSWQIASSTPGLSQLSFQIQAAADARFHQVLADTGTVAGSVQIGESAPGPALKSREVRFFRVRIQTESGWTSWSSALQVEAGLLEPSDFKALAIGDSSTVNSPAPALRNEIQLKEKPIRARLYVTSMGLNEFYINGLATSNSYLNPGWTAYQDRLLVETHDVTNLLTKGTNALGALLGDGWWRGRLGFMEQEELYGKDIGLLAQLEVTYPDGKQETFNTDESWKISTVEIVSNSIYDGTAIDYNRSKSGWRLSGYDDSAWVPAQLKDLPYSTLKPRSTNPVRKVAEFAMALEPQLDRTLLRGVQNISGWVRLTVDGKKGQKVVVRHAEVLEAGDKLHTKALRSAKATDTYILSRDGRHVLEPKFTFHGFQHADVVTDAIVISAVAVAISSDNARRGYFESSDTRLNRLHENVVWSQLDNFVSVPTDCPQRDERLGWTGDAQAFSNTSNTLFKSDSFWKSWLIDLALDQFENGDVGAIVPDILKHAPKLGDWILEGRAGWADAATFVPMSVYEYFGDKSVLRAQLESMRRWTDALDKRRNGQKFLPVEFQFGDWCDPDAPGDRPWEAKVSAAFVANAFFAKTASVMSQTEELVGDMALAKHYAAIATQLKRDIWADYRTELASTTAGCSIALEFDIVPPQFRSEVAAVLAQMAGADKGKIATGFLATPLILHALSKNGHTSQAYQMLMRREFRSWLYAVDKGATSMWERWDAIAEDGTLHSGAMDTNPEGQSDASMISFNHYAYGAVIDWVYRNVGGLAPVLSKPGYELALVSPKPAAGFSFANTTLKSSFGDLTLNWNVDQTTGLIVSLAVPFGARAELDLPVSPASRITCNGNVVNNGTLLSYGNYTIVVSEPEIVSY
jgi:alpha-L-rhamnosidase